MKKTLIGAMALSMIVPATANAAIVVTSTPATNPYSGPTPTYTFDTPTPVSGGSIVNGPNTPAHTRPFGSTGSYFSVGPLDGSPGVINLSAFGLIGSISFLWGSMDSFNILELLDSSNAVIFSITGQDVKVLNAPQPTNVNRVVKFTFTDGATQSAVAAVRLKASKNAFEIDNFAVGAVPEPTTWLMMILGFFGLSYALRSRNAQSTVRVRYT